MKFLLVVFVGCFAFCYGQRERYIHQKTKGMPWPIPKNISTSETTCFISEQLIFDFGDLANCDLMAEAERRAFRYVFRRNREGVSSDGILSVVAVRLNNFIGLPPECSPNVYPADDMDESYKVKVDCSSTPMATITANSVWGLLHGIETFTQLTYMNDQGYTVVNDTTIFDEPSYTWRGVLLDTSRHFLPMSILLKNLEIMATNKFNVFHWHIVDDPSFPWFSQKFPQLSLSGAYFPMATHSYSPGDVKMMLDKGRMLGIRIVPEFDTPGHTQSWGSGLPELLTQCYDKDGNPLETYGAIDPSSPKVWSLLSEIFQEVNEVFPDSYLHLGGDEVSFEFDCWLNNPRVKELMKVIGISTGAELQNYYTNQQLIMLDTITKEKGRYVYWEEVFHSGIKLPSDRTVVHVWYSNQTALANLTKTGLRGIYSSCWYLDHLDGTGDYAGLYFTVATIL